jgi:hypothetical protein
MKGSFVAMLVAFGVVIVVLLFGLGEAKRREEKAVETDEMREQLTDLKKQFSEMEAGQKAKSEKAKAARAEEKLDLILKKLEDMDKRLRKLEKASE